MAKNIKMTGTRPLSFNQPLEIGHRLPFFLIQVIAEMEGIVFFQVIQTKRSISNDFINMLQSQRIGFIEKRYKIIRQLFNADPGCKYKGQPGDGPPFRTEIIYKSGYLSLLKCPVADHESRGSPFYFFPVIF